MATRNRVETNLIMVHCSATPASMAVDARVIDHWHEKRGIYSTRGLTGYHYIVNRNGLVELGRDMRSIGAHALGYNDISVAICLVGGVEKNEEGTLVPQNNFDHDQFDVLLQLIDHLHLLFPAAHVVPHNAVSNKACPSFDVYDFMLFHRPQWASKEAAERFIQEYDSD